MELLIFKGKPIIVVPAAASVIVVKCPYSRYDKHAKKLCGIPLNNFLHVLSTELWSILSYVLLHELSDVRYSGCLGLWVT